LLFGAVLGAAAVYFWMPKSDSGRTTATTIKSPTVKKPSPVPVSPPTADDAQIWHVKPGMDIQQALDAAAEDPRRKVVRVHAGEYRPTQHAQAMIFFNARHDGITLEADGEVTLTAQNPDVADATVSSFPAVVNHVVYFGDGITRQTIFRGFRIMGAKNYLS